MAVTGFVDIGNLKLEPGKGQFEGGDGNSAIVFTAAGQEFKADLEVRETGMHNITISVRTGGANSQDQMKNDYLFLIDGKPEKLTLNYNSFRKINSFGGAHFGYFETTRELKFGEPNVLTVRAVKANTGLDFIQVEPVKEYKTYTIPEVIKLLKDWFNVFDATDLKDAVEKAIAERTKGMITEQQHNEALQGMVTVAQRDEAVKKATTGMVTPEQFEAMEHQMIARSITEHDKLKANIDALLDASRVVISKG